MSCIEALAGTGIQIRGILDERLDPGSSVLGYPVIGGDEAIPDEVRSGCRFLVTIGQTSSPAPRKRAFDTVRAAGGRLVALISASARVSASAIVGSGTIVMQGSTVNAKARIGENTIINNHSLVEHGTIIGSHCHVATGAIVNGDCVLGDGVMLGSGAVVIQGIRVASGAVIGAAAVVIRDIQQDGTYAGNPARLIHSR